TKDALKILEELGMPRAQINERSALTLLALLNLTPGKNWKDVKSPLMGITPIMNFCLKHYNKKYAPNTRETFRRQTIHQFLDAGLVVYNPDNPKRPVNSPKAVYQIEREALELFKSYRSNDWKANLPIYISKRPSLKKKYAKERFQRLIPLQINKGNLLHISPGSHSKLIKAVVEDFGPRFVPGGKILYVGETGMKWNYCDELSLKDLGVKVDKHGKMPDVVLYCPKRKWLILIESVTSHGPMDSKRHNELSRLFSHAKAGLVFVTAFASRGAVSRYLTQLAWETDVWIADNPSHLIHFNGTRFLGPY
ncbi:MAG: BsuBI/PstI family type II restriction endonuclease, partial [Candidatus Thorarchaeota archaeon]